MSKYVNKKLSDTQIGVAKALVYKEDHETFEDIANVFSIDRRTINRWKEKPAFQDAMEHFRKEKENYTPEQLKGLSDLDKEELEELRTFIAEKKAIKKGQRIDIRKHVNAIVDTCTDFVKNKEEHNTLQTEDEILRITQQLRRLVRVVNSLLSGQDPDKPPTIEELAESLQFFICMLEDVEKGDKPLSSEDLWSLKPSVLNTIDYSVWDLYKREKIQRR